VGVLEDLFNLGNGIRSGFEDVPALFKDIVTFDPHGAVTDGRKLIGDAGDVLTGVGQLGIDLGRVPEKYLGTFGKWADSPILSAAQLVIEGEKAMCGSGEPTDGTGYLESAEKLEDTVQHLVDTTEVIPDLWSGKAATAYDETGKEHRRRISRMSAGDGSVGNTLNTEAGQVSRTRKTLDDTSQYLYDYGLATAWMNYVPGANVAKIAADTAAASAALATTETTMLILANNVLENARAINAAREDIEAGTQDTSGDRTLGAFVDPRDDQKGNLPPRMQPGTKYHYPIGLPPPKEKPIEPQNPPPNVPVTPYDIPGG
jgi:uncharacterized protein YukE